MEGQELSREEMREMVKRGCEWTRKDRFEEAIEVFERCLPVLSEGDIQDQRTATATFSYYGVCVAMVNRKYADAVKYCKLSIKANFMDPEHRANLARVYLERNDRRRAYENIKAGLKLQPSNKSVNRILDEIGRRSQPHIPFLSRSNPINVWLGKKFNRASQERP